MVLQSIRSIYKNWVYFYNLAINTLPQFKKTVPFRIEYNGIKYLETNLTNEVQCLFSETSEMLVPEIKHQRAK